MANTTANVTTGKPAVSGSIYYAETTATLPTSATATITGFTSLGYISEDGVTNANSPTSENTKAWGGDIVLTTQTEKEDTFKFTALEANNADVLKAVYGDSNVTGTFDTGITVKANSKQLEARAWVIDMVVVDGVKRIVIPNAVISDIGDITYNDSDAVGYEITVSAHPDSAGQTHYEYIQKSTASAS